MENHTVVPLKAIAKERGIRGYYKLRMAALIHALVDQKSYIFDEPIPNDATPVLQPTPWRPSNITTKVKQNLKKFSNKGMQKIKDFGERLLNYIPSKPKVVNKVLESFKNKIKKIYENRDCLFQPTQTKSALKNFAIQYRIKRSNSYDPESFLLTLSNLLQTL